MESKKNEFDKRRKAMSRFVNYSMSERVKKLREPVLSAPEVCVERAMYMTQSYMQTEGEETVIRRGKALAYILDHMTVAIHDGELLVGETTSKRRGAFIMPEIQWKWYLDEMDRMSERSWDRCQPIGEFERENMKKYLPYWEDKCTWDKVRKIWDEKVLHTCGDIFTTHTSSMSGQHFGHIAFDYPRALSRGFRDIIEEANRFLEKLPITMEEQKRHNELKAGVIALEGVIRFANRYSELAREMAQSEQDAERKAELLEIARVCAKVPEFAPESFYEACQAVLFIFLAHRIEAYAPGVGLGRVDQYLYDYYQKDIAEGKLSKEQAVEYLEMILIKMNDLACLMSEETGDSLSGFPTLAGITIGGVKPDGTDAVNDLTYLLLAAENNVRLAAEEVVCRINRVNSDEFITDVCRLAIDMKGKIKFAGDDAAIKQLMKDGKPLEVARDYVVLGCATPTVPGKSLDITAGAFNIAMVLELALNNGKSRLSGKQLGPETGDPKQFKSMDEVWNAFKAQVESGFELAISSRNADRRIYAENVPAPYHTMMIGPCFETGYDIVDIGEKMWATEAHGLTGAPNVGDSLAAIQKYVFDEKKYTMAEVIDALDADFEGYEKMRSDFLSAPKFGNDNEYVDHYVEDILEWCDDIVSRYRGIGGTKHTLSCMAGTGNIGLGMGVGALPDGRKAGTPLSEGGISPTQGMNTSGPTASMNSVGKLDHTHITGGEVYNMRFNPGAVDSEEKLHKFVMMLRTYCEMGGYHVQFNFLSADTLRDAQKNPDKYRDLLVRVATYSAFFVELSRVVQDGIIEKTEFMDV